MMLRKLLGPKKEEGTAGYGYSVMRNTMFCTPHQILLA